MNKAELIEIRVLDNNVLKYSFLVECDYNGQDLLDIVSEELARGSDGTAVEAVLIDLLDEDGNPDSADFANDDIFW